MLYIYYVTFSFSYTFKGGGTLAIFAISDLHLSLSCDKPMDIFVNNWVNYSERIKNEWNKLVKEDDLVIVPGDISWATYLEDCFEDFNFINKLNGKKIILKGNHDYWWTTINKMNKYILENGFDTMHFLQNNSYQYKNFSICGTRGWSIKSSSSSELNSKIFEREKRRLILSLEDAKQKSDGEIIVAMHYPPVEKENINYDFIDIMKQYDVKTCIYGHLHAQSIKNAITGDFCGVNLKLVSCDSINFTPILL